MTTSSIIICAVLHIILCIVIYLCLCLRILKFSTFVMPLIIFLPVVGLIIAFVADYNSRFHKMGTKEITLEELHLGFEDLRLRNIEQETKEIVIPLEEAMAVNDAGTRRKLMLDILKYNPDEYITLFQKARMDEDADVAHYASTAMTEIQRNYEIELQKYEKEFQKNPGNTQNIYNYCNTIMKYIESGLIDENIVFVYRMSAKEALKALLDKNSNDMKVVIYAIENNLKMGEISEANALCVTLINNWPKCEEAYLTALSVCFAQNDRNGIDRILEEIEKRNVYLSPKGKNIIAFWQKKEEKESAEVN